MVERQVGISTTLPFVAMVIAMLAQTSNMVVSKVAMTDGLNNYVMVVCSFALSTLLLLPCLFLSRSSERPPLTFSTLCSFFLLALFGDSSVILTYAGIELSSTTLAATLLILIPAFTFVLALIFGFCLSPLYILTSKPIQLKRKGLSLGSCRKVVFNISKTQ